MYYFVFLGFILNFNNPARAYNTLDQGYVNDNPDILNCGSACIGAPEIQTIITTGFEIEKRGLYVEQQDSPGNIIETPWAQSRTKWLRKFGKNLYYQNRKYSASAFRIGVGIQDENRSFQSAVWSEIRKPLLYDLRNKIITPLREKYKNNAKVGVWAVEQTLDIGASAIGLDSYGYTSEVFDSDEIRNSRSSINTKLRPKIDPYKGRYGVQLQSKFYQGYRDPFYFEVSYFFCNNNFGVGDRVCSYLHQVQTAYGYRFRSNKSDISIQLSVYWEVKSLDPEAYFANEEFYDFKPFGFQSRISIAI